MVVDVDLINCFGMFEGLAIVGATSTHLPGAAPRVQLCSAEEVPVKLRAATSFNQIGVRAKASLMALSSLLS